ncbi:hypothetical protein WJX73_003470 [Symbiochloris irregularis]|uniref:Coenzyme Q-binding protein COQ10 START domain-containing protein n=1 Tax=Symbiochloris irregularis TaxID=706552 RepID=A0AAW1NWN6_9CHLO
MASETHPSTSESAEHSDISALPEAPDNVGGETSKRAGKHNITVSNVRGYLCHISSHGTYDCPPGLIFALFTNPDNTGIFRDIKKVTSRTVLKEDTDGLKVVEVEQMGEVRILWKMVQFRTLLKVTEDARDPENLSTQFELIRSDVLGRFNGGWHLQPLRRKNSEEVIGTTLRLEQDVTPRGVPSFLKHMPVLGHVLRGICVRAVQRLLEDISAAVAKVESGKAWEDVIKPAPAPVHSHAISLQDLHVSDSDDDSPTKGHAHPDAAAAAGPTQQTVSSAGGSPLTLQVSHSDQRPDKHSMQDTKTQPHSNSGKEGVSAGGFWDSQSWMPSEQDTGPGR